MTGLRIAPTGEAEWAELRDTRLRALASDPWAFGSTPARESAFSEAVWRERARSGRTMLARRSGVVVGIVAAVPAERPGDGRELVSMWVAPEERGRGVGRLLVEAVTTAAARDGVRRVTLYVAEGNDGARSFYERLGFTATGRRQALPSDPARAEDQLGLDV